MSCDQKRLHDLSVLAIAWGVWCWVFDPMSTMSVFRLFNRFGGDEFWGFWMVGLGALSVALLRSGTWARTILAGACVSGAWSAIAMFFLIEAWERAETASAFHTGILMYSVMTIAAVVSTVRHARGGDSWIQ